MSPLFFILKSNLEFAVRCKDKIIYDMAMAEIDNSELTRDEIEELRSITLNEVENEPLNANKEVEVPKACLLDDPTCESCSS